VPGSTSSQLCTQIYAGLFSQLSSQVSANQESASDLCRSGLRFGV